jgi:hypothetical protein
MHRERVGLGPHFFQRSFGFAKRFAKVSERVLKPICLHTVHSNIYAEEGQFV